MDQRARNLMTIQKVLHPRDDINRLYMFRKGGGRELANIEDSVGTSIRRLKDYLERNKERLITANKNNTNSTRINRTTITSKQKWNEKLLYVYFKRQTSEIAHEKIWRRKGTLKRETESLSIAVLNNATVTNYAKAKIDRTQKNCKSTLCANGDETIYHITANTAN